jgi:uncharacterized protein with FMN-binding domain
MKKYLLSILMVALFALHLFYQRIDAESLALKNVANNTIPSASPVAFSPPAHKANPPAPVTKPVAKPVAKPGMYKDGTYTGAAADAYYGNIQVNAIVQNGKLADIIFLQYPSDQSQSREINTRAIPLLRSEAIAAQSANVNIVSRATDSSQAFRQSLASALAQAKS